MEVTSWRWGSRIRYLPHQGPHLTGGLHVGDGDWHRLLEGEGIGMQRPVAHRFPGTGLDDLPEEHHRHSIGDVPNHRQVVGRKIFRRI
jgi:hypothetical protein